jgi:ABC-2 type transport system ATP-binding protein
MTTSSPPAIAAVGLRKSYGDKVVLDGIDLTVPAGTIFSLLGPNGAGKTTAVRILSTLIRADGGQVRVAGHDLAREPDSVRAAIGVTGQFSAVDNLLTGEENLIAPGTAGLRCVTPGARARLLTPEPEQLPDWMGERRPRI